MNTASSNGDSRPTVLVGFAEASAAPEVVWSLVDEGFDVLAFARRGRASALRHSRHVVCHDITAPESNVQETLSDMRALLTSLGGKSEAGPRILFPLDDSAVWLCSRLQLDSEWLLAGPRGTNAELALDKHLQTQLARDAGFDVPKTVLAHTERDVFRFSAAEPFPLILKPAECVPVLSGRRYMCRKWICANPSELESALKEWAGRVPLLVQSFIAGTGEGVFGLAAPDGVRAWSAHRRLRMMNPLGSGSSACISQSVSPDLRIKVEALIRRAEWRGLFMVELLRDDSGNPWFVELNGRPWGSMALSRRQGLEYPAWHLMLAMDQDSRAGLSAPSTSSMVCRHVGRELMHLLFVLRGPKSKALGSWPSFWRSIGGVMRVGHGDTFYNWRRQDPKVFLADCYYTLHDNLLKSRN